MEKQEPAVSLTERFMKVANTLATKVEQRGGNLSETLVRVGGDPTKYGVELNRIADVLASVYHTNAGLTVPEGGRVYTLTVQVDESRGWEEVVRAVGYSAHDRNRILEVADKFPPKPGATPSLREVVLVCFEETFDKSDLGETVLPWGEKNHLKPATPRTVFAIAEQCPDLALKVGVGSFLVNCPVAIKAFKWDHPHVIGVSLTYPHCPKAYLHWIENCSPTFNKGEWFAFVRDSDPLSV